MKLYIKNNTLILLSPGICRFFKRVFGFSIGAVALFPFVIVRDEEILNSPEYINHESIHIRQYVETLIVGILVIGLFQYFYALIVLRKSRLQAYYFMSHEQEAHQNDQNLDYLKTRPWFSFYRYLLPRNKMKMDLVEGKRVIFK